MTQKPLLPGTSTSKPIESNSKPQPQPSTSKPDPNSSKPESSTQVPVITTSKPLEEVVLEEKPLKNKGNNTAENEKTGLNDGSTTSTTAQPVKSEDIISPGKIKVQIIQTPVNLSPMTGEELNLGQNKDLNVLSQNAEIIIPRKCASGYARDQKGRCRRLRKPAGSSL